MTDKYQQYTTDDLNKLLEVRECSTADAADMLRMKRSSMAAIRTPWKNPHTGEEKPNFVPYSIIFTLAVKLGEETYYGCDVPDPIGNGKVT